jgi:hypothetical protein
MVDMFGLEPPSPGYTPGFVPFGPPPTPPGTVDRRPTLPPVSIRPFPAQSTPANLPEVMIIEPPKQCQKPVTPNGCGSASTQNLVPDRPFGFDFTPACNVHDICYGTCGTTQKSCDDQFISDMYDICVREASSDINANLCMLIIANIYVIAVRNLGAGPFRDGQRDNCLTVPGDECCPEGTSEV